MKKWILILLILSYPILSYGGVVQRYLKNSFVDDLKKDYIEKKDVLKDLQEQEKIHNLYIRSKSVPQVLYKEIRDATINMDKAKALWCLEREKKKKLEDIVNNIGNRSFLANAIRSGANDDVSKLVFERLNNINSRSVVSAWMSPTYSHSRQNKDGCVDSAIGVIVGYDIYLPMEKLPVLGFYIKTNKHNLECDSLSSKGAINNVGVGVYSGISYESCHIKGALESSCQEYSTTRYLHPDVKEFRVSSEKATSKFGGNNVKFDAEYAMNIILENNLVLSPYICAGVSCNFYRSIKECGAGDFNISVKSGNYYRVYNKIGVALKKDFEKFGQTFLTVTPNVSYTCLATNNRPDLIISIDDVKLKSYGSSEDVGKVGIGLTADYKLSKDATLFADFNICCGKVTQECKFNIGFEYKFGMPTPNKILQMTGISLKKRKIVTGKEIIYDLHISKSRCPAIIKQHIDDPDIETIKKNVKDVKRIDCKNAIEEQ